MLGEPEGLPVTGCEAFITFSINATGTLAISSSKDRPKIQDRILFNTGIRYKG